MKNTRKLIIHVDVDSPVKLMNFYNISNVDYDQKRLDEFYRISWNRALSFFKKHDIKATFFVVGDELESSEVIQEVILKAFNEGHEIENHTYSHPFGLSELSDDKIVEEIVLCNKIIENITGVKAIGFRSPGYSINKKVINTLEGLHMKYDSSGFWSIMNPILKIVQNVVFKKGISNSGFGASTRKLKQKPYFPDLNNWLIDSKQKRSIIECPLPKTNFFSLPFYNNFNLWLPFFYSRTISKLIRKEHMIYLFHIIEFMDMTDDIPKELGIHPNIKKSHFHKIRQSGKIVENLIKRYQPISSKEFVNLILNTELS